MSHPSVYQLRNY